MKNLQNNTPKPENKFDLEKNIYEITKYKNKKQRQIEEIEETNQLNYLDSNIKKEKIKDFDKSDRPRELLMSKGSSFLTDEQLLAILIHTGNKNENAVQISKRLIDFAGGMENLAKFDVNMIQKIKGLGEAKACMIVAAIEFANRVVKKSAQKKNVSIDSPKKLIEIYSCEFECLNVEVFKLVCLNTKNQIIYDKNITKGIVNASLVSPREVFKEAILRHCSSIIVLHNHPSGNCTPSEADISITKKLFESGKILEINLLDHIIYGNIDDYYSFRENGYL